jgi:hypothetical protein
MVKEERRGDINGDSKGGHLFVFWETISFHFILFHLKAKKQTHLRKGL